jgi:hypothetical protein
VFNFYCLIFALSFHFSIDFVGNLYLAQIIIILTFIFFYFHKDQNLKNSKILNNIIIFGFFWLIGQIISDIINQSIFNDYARGITKIIITIMSFYVFFKIDLKIKNGLIKILSWIVMVKILFLLMDINSFNEFKYYWKMGLGTSISIIVLIYLNHRNNYKSNTPIFFLIILAFFSLYFETRYLFIVNLISALFIYLSNQQNKYTIFKFTLKHIFYIIIFTALSIYIFQYLLKSDMLPKILYGKTISQQGNYGLLLGGRSDLIGGLKAIADSPFIGHGSWAKDCFYTDYINNFLLINEYGKTFTDKNCLIPGHSIILEAWIYSGFMGLIFWIYIFVILIKRIKFNFVHTSKFYLILIFLNTIVIWDFFLSPYGGTRLIEFPLYLAILFFLNKNKELQND